MNFNLIKFLTDVSTFVILMPLLVGGMSCIRLSKDSLLILGVVFFGSIPQLLNFFQPCEELLNNVLYNLYTPLEFLLYGLLFAKKWQDAAERKIFSISIILYFFLSIIFVAKWGIEDDFIYSWAWTNNLIYVIWILVFLYGQYNKNVSLIFTPGVPFFWFLIGILLYAPCTMLVFSMWDFLYQNKSDTANTLRIIHAVFNINMYVFFTIGFLKDSLNFKK